LQHVGGRFAGLIGGVRDADDIVGNILHAGRSLLDVARDLGRGRALLLDRRGDGVVDAHICRPYRNCEDISHRSRCITGRSCCGQIRMTDPEGSHLELRRGAMIALTD
jgi:hypothetical protein